MLRNLYIKNFILIDELSVDFNEGFYRPNWKEVIKGIIDDFGNMSFEDHELNLYHD